MVSRHNKFRNNQDIILTIKTRRPYAYHIRILKDSTLKYGLEEPEFVSFKSFNIDKRIIFIPECRMKNQAKIATGNIAIITENEAAFKQIKLMQEFYDLLEEKCTSNNCSKKSTKKTTATRKFFNFSHKRSFICEYFSLLTNNSSFRLITNSICSLF